MPEAVFDICADVTRDNRSRGVIAKQFDVKSRYLKVHITNRGRAVIVPTSSTVAINIRRPDGEAKAFSGVVNPDGTVKVPLNSWALELEGELLCDISVVGTDGSKLTTTSFKVTVERSTYSGEDVSQDPESMDIITEVLTGLGELNNKMPNYVIGPGLAVSDNTLYVTAGIGEGGTSISVDPTLTVEGLAADAKATGEAIKKLSGSEKAQATVTYYGAVGDGVSDDTEAIQMALDSMKNGGTIVFPTGVYKVTAPLLVYSNQTLEMNGSTILQGAAINNLMRNYNSRDDANNEPGTGGYAASENVKILNGVFDGGSYTTDNTLLGFEHSKNILIEGCTFKNGYGSWHDIEINSTKYAAIRNCIFESTRRNGQNACIIQVDSYNNNATWPWLDGPVDNTVSDTVMIEDCHFECNSLSPAVGNHSTSSVKNIIIQNNTFENGTSGRNVINFQSADKVFVTGNIFSNCSTDFAKNITANNNIIDGELSAIGGSSSQTYSVAYNLINCTSNNDTTAVTLGVPYITTLTAPEGYAVSLVTVKMAGMDITSSVYSNGLISIPSVSGNIVINAVAEQENSDYTAVYAIPSSSLENYMIKPATNNKTYSASRLSYLARDLILETGAIYKITYTGSVMVGVQQYNQNAYAVGMDAASYNDADKQDSGWQASGYEWTCPDQINGSPTKGTWLTFNTGSKDVISNIVIYKKKS